MRSNASLARDFIDNGKSIGRVSMLAKLGIHRQHLGAGATYIAGDRFVGEHFSPVFTRSDMQFGPAWGRLDTSGPASALNHYPISVLGVL